MKAFCSWSGGKDSVLSLYLARKSGIEPIFLLNMMEEEGKYSRSHGISKRLIEVQAEQMGMILVQRNTSWKEYENVFKETVLLLKNEGVEAGIFGDIDIEEHREWIDRVCREVGIVPVLPLWKKDREEILLEFIKNGFKAIVCAVKFDIPKPFLGREIDRSFIDDMKALSMDPCGEQGEFHTFVYDGPLFRRSLRVVRKGEICKDGYRFLDIGLEES